MQCNIYVTFEGTDSELIKLTRNQFLNTLEKIEIVIDENGEYNPSLSTNFPDGFLYFKFLVYIYPTKDIDIIAYKKDINSYLMFLWDDNIPAVAAADFEEELYQNGGYKSSNIPWPIKR